MDLLNNTVKIYIRSKIIFIINIAMYIWTIVFMHKYYKLPMGSSSITLPLERALKLSFYLFIIFMFLSYEYYSKIQKKGVSEIIQCTLNGRKKKHLFAAFGIVTINILILTIVIGAITCIEYKYYQVNDYHNEYIIHIIKNMFVNIFMILELASCIGMLVSKFKNRITAYLLMLAITYCTSPYPEKIADAQCMAGNIKHSIYPIVEFFNIMPLVNDGFPTNYMFGQSILGYRIFLILFWIAVCIFAIFLLEKMNLKKCILAGILCLAFYTGYALPASKVSMNGNPENTMAHDQYYYETGRDKTKNEKADYQIKSYDMKIKIGRQLRATVKMKVDHNLAKYKMTLYHGYKVKKVYDQNKKQLKFKQKQDYIEIDGNKKVSQIIMKYEGNSPAYYSNSQGIYLPGHFAYYPRAGYIALYSRDDMAINSCFVSEKTRFKVSVDYGKRIYTNLKKNGKTYEGNSDGCTLIAGFYKEKKFGNGNRIIYDYLYDECYMQKGGMEEIIREDNKNLIKQGKDHVTIFVVPNVNQTRSREVGKKQVLLRNSPWY